MKFVLIITMWAAATPVTFGDLSAERCHAMAVRMLENPSVQAAECVAQPISWLWLLGREGK